MVKIHEDKIVNPEPNCLKKEDDDFNDGHWLEAMDRCMTICDMIDHLLVDHPAIKRVLGGQYLATDAIDTIQRLYNMIPATEVQYKKLDKHVTKE